MDEIEERKSILAMCWEHGGNSMGYAWYSFRCTESEDACAYMHQAEDDNFPWNAALTTENQSLGPPCIYVGTFYGKQINTSSVLHELRLSTLPSLYLVPQRTTLPSALTESVRSHESDKQMSVPNFPQAGQKIFRQSMMSESGKSSHNVNPHGEELVLPFVKVKYMHPVEFSADVAREIVSRMSLGNNPPDPSVEFENSRHEDQRLSFHVDTRSNSMMCALGGLLTYLQRTFPSEFPNFPGSSASHRVDILPHQIHFQVFLEEDTYRELEIFKREPHPASHQLMGSPKEGLSLYGIISRFCRTSKGSALLREILIRPTNDAFLLNNRLRRIGFLCENQDFTLDLHKKIHSVDHPITLFQRLRRGVHSPSDWYKLSQVATNYRGLVEMLYSSPILNAVDVPLHPCNEADTTPKGFSARQNVEVDCTPVGKSRQEQPLSGNVQRWCDALTSLQEKVKAVLDIESCINTSKFVIREGYDKNLDRLCLLRDTMSDFLTTVARKELESLPEEIAFSLSLNVIYVPQFGYHIALPSQCAVDERTLGALIDGFGWIKSFYDDESLFFKNPKMRELDAQLGDVNASVQDLQASIIRELEESTVQNTVICYLFSMNMLAFHVGGIDALCAMAHAANEYGWSRPVIQADPTIFIQNGRHPLLQSNCARSTVGNDTHLEAQDGPAVSILTGANGSGKSIYLKQVALLAYMAHIGSFVPAEKMVVGPISAILTCIGSPMHSSFASDLARVGRMLRFPVQARRYRPLLCIDEFGKGTLAEDGVALLTSLVKDLVQRSLDDMPFVVMTTHYTEILRNLATLVDKETLEKFLEVSVMSVLINESETESGANGKSHDDAFVSLPQMLLEKSTNRDVHASVRYTYRKTPGIGTRTYSLPLALYCGIPESVVEHAGCAWRGLSSGKSLTDIILEEKIISDLEIIFTKHKNQTQRWLERNPGCDAEAVRRHVGQSNTYVLDAVQHILASPSENEIDSACLENLDRILAKVDMTS
ncbi:mutS protein [Perkinsela sp. CCAP 1560/4]|nr:mutS protein [Perkinsela sp. CCAP 1560/4]|eukprot:KNH07436.1 mutS protein [Perkinsela sp. CCAP 1560/4]